MLYCLRDLFLFHDISEHIRSDNGPEFTAKVVRKWLERIGVRTLFIKPGSPWENGSYESFNGKLRDEVLNREVFYNLREAKVVIEKRGQVNRKFFKFKCAIQEEYRHSARGRV